MESSESHEESPDSNSDVEFAIDGKPAILVDGTAVLESHYRMIPETNSNRFEPKGEVDVYPAISELMHRAAGLDGSLITLQEFEGPVGVPDFIAVTHIRNDVMFRDLSTLPIVRNRADAVLLGAVPVGRAITTETIARRLGIDVKLAAQKTNKLVTSGHLLPLGRGFVRHQQVAPLGRIHAFEAKVKDWQSALAQAFRYSLWCDVSSACMLQLPTERRPAIVLASNLGVGLTLGEEWMVKPRQTNTNDGLRLFASELLLARLQLHHS